MQKIISKAFLALFLGISLVSCQDDYIKAPNGSTSTSTVTIPTTSGFIGKFKGKISGSIVFDPTYVSIVATSKANEVSVTLDFGALGAIPGIIATISGNSISIAKQTIDGSEFSGTGTLTNDTKLDFTMTEKNSTGTFNYTYTGTKQ